MENLEKNKESVPENKTTGEGINIIGSILIFGSIYHLVGIVNYTFYQFMFQQLPEESILPRYILSISFRVITLIIGIGLLFRKEIFRKLVLGVCILTLCILPWKHPFYVFQNFAIYNEYNVRNTEGNYPLKDPWMPYVSMGFYCLIDVIFCAGVIWYLRKKEVKEFFQN